MKLSKRIAIIFLILLISGITILGYFLHLGRKNFLTDPYKAVAPDACLVFETSDLQSFINSLTTGKDLFSEIDKIKELSGFNLKLKYFADQLNKPAFKKFVQGGTSLIAFYPSSRGKLLPLLSMTVPAELNFRQVKESLSASGNGNFREQKINGRLFFELPYTVNGNSDTIFLHVGSGLLISCTSREIAGKVFSPENQGSDIRNAPGFSRVLQTSGKNGDKLFVIFSNLTDVIKPLLSHDKEYLTDWIVKLGNSAGEDININEDGISINGYTESSGPDELLNSYKSLIPADFHSIKVLPSATALFESRIMKEGKVVRNKGTAFQDDIYELAASLKPYIGEEITRAFIDIKNNPVAQNTIILYELKNRVQFENNFVEKLKKKLSVGYFQPDDQTKIPVYFTGGTGLVSILNPDFAAGFNDLYYTFYDNYMICGNSYITVSRFLYDNMLNKTLANDIVYRDFEKMLPSRAAYIFYCTPSHIIDYLAGYLNNEIIEGLRSNKNFLNKIQSIGFQLAPINGMLYNSLSLRYKEEVVEESKTEWETLLDTTASIKPFFFTNHITGAREIFIQDMNNNAYLINAAGRVLWKVPLREKINSSVYMIDYYKNGKYQLFFSGKNYLHVLDRNGNYVERFPVKLRSPASNPCALFDYDNNKNYRLVIAGEDKVIYSYEKNGSVVKGWKQPRVTGNVLSESVFYRISGKDYIIIADQFSLYFLDRSGNIRLKLKEEVTKARNSTIRLAPGSESYLVCTSPDGTVQNISFDGNVTKFSLRPFSANHSFDFFDLDGDGFGEYIFIDKGILYLYDDNRKEIFTRDFKSDKLGGPINFIFSGSDRKTGVFDGNKNLIYLIDSKGSIMKGFPLRGASMFSVGKLSVKNDWQLIVGGTDKFLYNYKLDTSAN